MQLPNQIIFLGSLANALEAGLETGEVRIPEVNFTFYAGNINKITQECRCPCEATVWSVQCVVATGCDPCDNASGFKIVVDRDATFNNESYLGLSRIIDIDFPFNPYVTSTAADVAAYAIDQINNAGGDGRRGPAWFSAALDPADVANETIIITGLECGNFEVYNKENYPPVVASKTIEGRDGALTADEVARKFPLGVGFIPGAPLGGTFGHQNGNVLFCQSPCKITLHGCVPSCTEYDGTTGRSMAGDRQNAVHLHGAATPFNVELWVDGDDANYLTFLDDIETLVGLDIVDVTICNEASGSGSGSA